MKTRGVILGVAVAVLLPSGLLSLCLEGRLKGGAGPHIPVYLVAPNNTFLNVDRGVVRHQLELALDNWYEKGAASVRPYFAGIVDGGSPGNGEVYVKETSKCGRCKNNACEKTRYSLSTPLEWGDREASTVWLERGCQNTCYNVYPGQNCGAPNEINLQGIFTHEIGHSLGLEDEYNQKCEGVQWSSAMAQNCNFGRPITRRDIAGLQALYGSRVGTYDYVESGDGALSWSVGNPQNNVPLGHGTFRIGSMGSDVDRESWANVAANASPLYTAAVEMKPGVDYDYVIPKDDVGGRTWDVAAAAQKSDGSRAIALMSGEAETDCRHTILILITEDDGASFSQHFLRDSQGDLVRTWAEGVSLAYDPERDVYLVAFAVSGHDGQAVQTFNTVVVASIDAAPPYLDREITIVPGEKTIDTPAVACGHTSITGSDNCMLMWLGIDGYNVPRWTSGSIDSGGRFQFGAINRHPYVGWQTPSLVVQDNRDFPWVMALKQNSALFTWRHTSSPTGAWVDERLAVWRRNGGLLGGALSFVRQPPVAETASASVLPGSAVRTQEGPARFFAAELHAWYEGTVY